jgi:4-hydroxyacetophenone monooxygenase
MNTTTMETRTLTFPPYDELARHLAPAALPALLMLVAHLTDDPSVLKREWSPDPSTLPRGGYRESVAASIREFCLERLAGFAGSEVAFGRPSPEVLRAIAHWTLDVDDAENLKLLDDVLSLDGEDHSAPSWTLEDVAPGRQFPTAIIGAGLSGLLMALRLKQAGIPFTIYEKDEDLGGTWWENDYPDCRTDVPSHIYMYSFEAYDWPSYFSRQNVIHDFLGHFADKHGLRDHISFRTEVLSATWDDDESEWVLSLRDLDSTRTERVKALVAAVGQLNRPSIPKFPGAESFRGPQFHSADWDHSVDWDGKRVAVIGTGASSLQFGPAMARTAERVTVFQRTPPWLLPTPELRAEIPADERWLFSELPGYRAWYRFSIFVPKLTGELPAATVDPDYPPTERAVSAESDLLRTKLTAYLEAQIGEEDWLREHVLPSYPPGSKRIVRDDGTWVGTLKRPNVDVVKGGVREITPDGIIAEDGQFVPCDVIVYGTGFKASDFLLPMTVTGRGGADIQTRWHGTAAAYMGVTVPDFPNLFLLYGPNTGVIVHGNLVFFIEGQANYAMTAIRLLLQSGADGLSLKTDVYDQYRREIEEANALRVWGWSSVSSWYKNAAGKSPIMWPLSTLEFWQRTRAASPDHYELLGGQR